MHSISPFCYNIYIFFLLAVLHGVNSSKEQIPEMIHSVDWFLIGFCDMYKPIYLVDEVKTDIMTSWNRSLFGNLIVITGF
jgi:hypothetical protein